MRLGDLLDLGMLAQHINAGYVSERCHETAPLRILNYTPRTQYERMWDDVTRQCRGLIYREGPRQEVVARPWPKFYNYGEHPDGSLDLDATTEVTDKVDGSLGIVYPACESCGHFEVATRGSFHSDQATHATAVLRERYPGWCPPEGWTALFEIIYPENRIVVDYGDRDDLVLLGAVCVETGEIAPARYLAWNGPMVDVMSAFTLRDALALEPRANAEGLVVRDVASGTMVKIKQDDYVELHRIVTGLSERVVWERLGAGETVQDICAGLPDEFQAWVEDVYIGLQFRADNIYSDAHMEYNGIKDMLPDGYTRRDFAEIAKGSRFAPFLFMLYDGKDPRSAIWRTVRP